jgi:regulator of replication initiation timing
MAQMRGSSKGKEDEMSTLRNNLQAKMIENTELQSNLTALQTQLNQILEQNKDIASLSKLSADQQN